MTISKDFFLYYNSKDYSIKQLRKHKGLINANYVTYNQFYYNLLNLAHGEKVLDIGCGIGGFVDFAVQKGADGYGIDFSESCINLANKNFKGKFYVGDIKDLPFENNFFDKIFCNEVIEHLNLEEASCAVKEIFRVLKKGGILVLKTPNRSASLYRILNYFMRCFKHKRILPLNFQRSNYYNHIKEYTKKELLTKFKEQDFSSIKIIEHSFFPQNKFLTKIFNMFFLRKFLGIKLIVLIEK